MTILSNNQVETNKGTIFKVDRADVLSTTKATIEKVTLFNTIATQQTIVLYMKAPNGPSRKLRQFQLQQNESAEYLEPGEKMVMNNGFSIEAETTTAGAVDFVVMGVRS